MTLRVLADVRSDPLNLVPVRCCVSNLERARVIGREPRHRIPHIPDVFTVHRVQRVRERVREPPLRSESPVSWGMSKFLRRTIRYSGVTEVVQNRLRPMPKLSLAPIDLTIAVGKEDILIGRGRECRRHHVTFCPHRGHRVRL